MQSASTSIVPTTINPSPDSPAARTLSLDINEGLESLQHHSFPTLFFLDRNQAAGQHHVILRKAFPFVPNCRCLALCFQLSGAAMSVTTTLMTFMVRTPPTTRSVTLWGSWDNFSTPYTMLRDTRIGPEHWSGCHNFSNIICDGHLRLDTQPRQGGLKMGGTYWYYYKLDDDNEFHNSTEPSTTSCPMLPGQLVNVLSVPMALSGNRSRNASVSSTSSDHRTMNPQDKYVNPRPVPKPTLPRLKTSPTFRQDDWPCYTPSPKASSRNGRSATSGPGSASTLRFRSKSPGSALSGSIRLAFRTFKSTRSQSPGDRSARSAIRSPSFERPERPRLIVSAGTSRDASPTAFRTFNPVTDHDLLLRRPTAGSEGSAETIDVPSFQQHRRQRSRSRDPSSLRNSLVLDNSAPLALLGGKQLHTLKEVASTQNTPAYPNTAIRADEQNLGESLDLEKRLPTLPNTPSSAYPASTIFRESTDIEALQSHFSSTTIDTSDGEDEMTSPGALRFSNWSESYASAGRSSFYPESFIEDEPTSASVPPRMSTPMRACAASDAEYVTDFEDTPQPPALPPRNIKLSTAVSSSSMSTASNSSMPASPSDYDHRHTSYSRQCEPRSPSRFKYQHYRLPEDEHGSEITLKSPAARRDGLVEVPSHFDVASGPETPRNNASMAHSTNMQQLIDELAYLGEMIHHK